MKHERLLINIATAVTDGSATAARRTVTSVVAFLTKHGFTSLELSMTAMLKGLLELEVSQADLLTSDGHEDDDDFDYEPHAYVSCVGAKGSLVFVDLESLPTKKTGKKKHQNFLELDIFSSSQTDLKALSDHLIKLVSKCLKLSVACEIRRGPNLVSQTAGWPLRKKLEFCSPVDERHYHFLVNPANRGLLRELKKRGSVLERDVKELNCVGVSPNQASTLLEKAAVADGGLVEKKYAIVCRKTQEIIFLLSDRKGVVKAKDLECPKCSKKIGTEIVVPHFSVTDALRALLDRSRWMPVFVKQTLVKLGVSPDDICTEVKYGEDEIDLLVFYRGRVLIFETKDRPVNLNDAYKLSAKTSRIESFLAKPQRTAGRGNIDDLPIDIAHEDIEFRHARRRAVAASILPIVVSTQDIAKDARDLLRETREDSRFVENCEAGLIDFLCGIIDEIDGRESRQRFSELTSPGENDSAGSLAVRLIQTGFQNWRTAAWPAKPKPQLRRSDSKKPK